MKCSYILAATLVVSTIGCGVGDARRRADEPQAVKADRAAAEPGAPAGTGSATGGSIGDTFLAVGCTSNSECGSGFCVGGVCCNTACTDQCSACNLPGSEGTCTFKEIGAPCSDGDACTLDDFCWAGTCLAFQQVTCPVPYWCIAEGTCDHATGICSWPNNQPDGTSCDDYNACTQTDSCVGGLCVGSNAVVCTAGGQCQVPGTCNESTGGCSNQTNAPDGAGCSDGDGCTLYESCLGGTCVPGVQITCPAPAWCLADGACNPTTGGCEWPNSPNGSFCDDFNACTQTDSCVGGVCVGSNPVVCASDECHAPGTCSPVDGTCSTPILPACNNVGAFDYDKAGRLIRDRQAELHYDGYDQLLEVLPIASPPPLTNLPVEDLEVPDELQATAGRMNAAGAVPVQVVMASSFATHTFLFKGVGQPVDLNGTVGHSGILAGTAMADSGAVAGGWVTEDLSSHAFRYDAAGFHDLITGDYASASDVNAANEVVGSFGANGSLHCFIHTDATGFQELGTLGGANCRAWAIDNDGVVSASAQLPDSPSSGYEQYGHAALHDAVSGLQDLNDLVDPMTTGMTLVFANQKRGDWVVGGGLMGGSLRAYRMRLSTGANEDIGWAGTSSATAVNSTGDAVGWAYLEASNTTQVAWVLSERTGLVKLNDLIDPGSGWNLQSASGIDELGDVVGTGLHNGRTSAFRLRIPAHSTGTGGPMVAEVHTYGFDGVRTSTTTAPGTANANTQFWFTQDYTEHDGKREHYVRVGNRIVAKVTLRPPMGGGGMGALIDPRHPPILWEDLVAKILLALLLAGGLGATGAGLIGKKRRPVWVTITAGPVLLFFVASCEELNTKRQSAATVWERIETVYFHHGIAAGPAITTNGDGTLREERRYEPFGQPVDANLGGTAGPVDFRLEQQNSLGKLTNPNTGWSYHGARWMQPQTARWTAPDPAVRAPGPNPWDLNPYQYVGQSPTLSWDPNGAEKVPQPLWTDVSTTQFRSLAQQAGLLGNLRDNQAAGAIFEATALKLFPSGGGPGIPPNTINRPSQMREAFFDMQIRPDAIGDSRGTVLKGLSPIPIPEPSFMEGGMFIDAKAKKGTLNLRQNDHQLGGFVDALRERMADEFSYPGVNRVGHLQLLTTSDASFDRLDALFVANQGIVITQRVLQYCEACAPGKRFRLSELRVLTPTIIHGGAPSPMLGKGPPGDQGDLAAPGDDTSDPMEDFDY